MWYSRYLTEAGEDMERVPCALLDQTCTDVLCYNSVSVNTSILVKFETGPILYYMLCGHILTIEAEVRVSKDPTTSSTVFDTVKRIPDT